MIRLLSPWNGYPTGATLTIADANTEATLVRQGIATTDFTSGFLSVPQTPFEQAPAVLLIAQSAQPVIVISSGTITATGALTGMAALPYTPIGVVKVYVAASAGLTAGVMFARYTSTTACQLFTDAAGTITPTGLTPGTYTGPTSTSLVLATVPVPANLLGPNGGLRIMALWSFPNNVNTKICGVQFGGQAIGNVSVTTNTTLSSMYFVRNQNNLYTQIVGPPANGHGTGAHANTVAQLTVDTTQQTLVSFVGGHGNAGDFLTLEGFSVEALPAP